MERLLAVWLPELARESDDGSVTRTLRALRDDLTLFCPFTELVRYGLLALPVKGPSRFLGGEEIVLASVREIVTRVSGCDPLLGVADGLFAATAAARRAMVLAPGETEAFRAGLPVEELGNEAFATTARRLGLARVGDVASLPASHVTERFSRDVVALHQVARGERDVWEDLRDPVLTRRLREVVGEEEEVVGQMSFFGDRTDADRRAAAAAQRVSTRLGVEAVWTARRQGGRTPADQVVWRPFGAPSVRPSPAAEPWPGKLPSPSPSTVLRAPVRVRMWSRDRDPVHVTSRGLFSASPHALELSPRQESVISFVAGPWPHDDGWWTIARRRAHVQVVLEDDRAFWLYAERGCWWLAGVYD